LCATDNIKTSQN